MKGRNVQLPAVHVYSHLRGVCSLSWHWKTTS